MNEWTWNLRSFALEDIRQGNTRDSLFSYFQYLRTGNFFNLKDEEFESDGSSCSLPFLFIRCCFPGRLNFKSFTDNSWVKLGESRILYPSNRGDDGAAAPFNFLLLRTLWADISRDGITQIKIIILINRIFFIFDLFFLNFSLLLIFTSLYSWYFIYGINNNNYDFSLLSPFDFSCNFHIFTHFISFFFINYKFFNYLYFKITSNQKNSLR